MTNRVTVVLSLDEQEALHEMCKQEVRPAKNFLRWLVVNEALRRGVLPTNANSDVNPRQGSHVAVAA